MYRKSRTRTAKAMVAIAIISVVAIFVIGIATRNASPQYATPRDGYVYYKLEDLPKAFSHSLGYIPEMTRTRNKAEIHMRYGIVIDIPVCEYAEGLWGFECPENKVNTIRDWGRIGAYPLFQTELDYCNQDGMSNVLAYVGWKDSFTLSSDGTSITFSDDETKYKLVPKEINNIVYVEAISFYQALYDHEMKYHQMDEVHFDIFL